MERDELEFHAEQIAFILLIGIILSMVFLYGCAAAPTATAHVYSKPDGTILYCPEELVPEPTTWDYNGTAVIQEDQILAQCELE